jgi:hypothetical protein
MMKVKLIEVRLTFDRHYRELGQILIDTSILRTLSTRPLPSDRGQCQPLRDASGNNQPTIQSHKASEAPELP